MTYHVDVLSATYYQAVFLWFTEWVYDE